MISTTYSVLLHTRKYLPCICTQTSESINDELVIEGTKVLTFFVKKSLYTSVGQSTMSGHLTEQGYCLYRQLLLLLLLYKGNIIYND